MTGNGTPATRMEVALVKELLEAQIKPVAEDVGEIKATLNTMASQAWLGPKGRDLIVGAGFVSALAAVLVSVFH